MPRYRADDLVTINLPTEGEWVRVKSKLSRGDQTALQQAIARNAKTEGVRITEIDAPTLLEYWEFALLDVVIKEWSWDDPVTPEGIRELDGESVDCIKAKLEDLYPVARTESESADLKEPSSISTPEARDTSPLSLVGT